MIAEIKATARLILQEVRAEWLIRSLIETLGYKKYWETDHGRGLLRVLEGAKEPRLIAHPKLAVPLRKNMGWIGRWFGYKVVEEPFAAEGTISAMDFAILNDWKKPQPVSFPSDTL